MKDPQNQPNPGGYNDSTWPGNISIISSMSRRWEKNSTLVVPGLQKYRLPLEKIPSPGEKNNTTRSELLVPLAFLASACARRGFKCLVNGDPASIIWTMSSSGASVRSSLNYTDRTKGNIYTQFIKNPLWFLHYLPFLLTLASLNPSLWLDFVEAQINCLSSTWHSLLP